MFFWQKCQRQCQQVGFLYLPCLPWATRHLGIGFICVAPTIDLFTQNQIQREQALVAGINQGMQAYEEGGLVNRCVNSGWKPTNLTFVFTLRISVFLASWYYAEGLDTDVKYRCSRLLDGLVSSHPCFNCQYFPIATNRTNKTKQGRFSCPLSSLAK